MKYPHAFLLAGLSAAGLLTGYLSQRISSGGARAWVPAAAEDKPGAGKSGGISPAPAADVLPEIPHHKSADTVETLLALDAGKNYGRLAAWLVDASEEEIAAYWAGYGKGESSEDVMKLIFIHWTRVNPQAALAAVAGTKDESHAWWAWGTQDPAAALAAAVAEDTAYTESVVQGIGVSDPEWARKHLSEIPEKFRDAAMKGMDLYPAQEDPEASLAFMEKNQRGFDIMTFKSLARKDPWAAWDWLKTRKGLEEYRMEGEGTPMDVLVSTMSREHPEDLDRLMAKTPPGAERRKMEDAIFTRLAEEDPAAALEKARKEEAPMVAVQRLGEVGLGMVRSDPEQAYAIARELLVRGGGQLGFKTVVEYAGGTDSSGESHSKARELMDELFSKDPARTAELTVVGDKLLPNFSEYAALWANWDLEAFAEWTNRQTQPEVRKQSVGFICNELYQLDEYAEAMEWARSGGHEYSASRFSRWWKNQPEAAEAWLQNVNAPEEEKASYRQVIERKK
ncbi:MAG: hypothetical protein V4584_16855 [Verrucomicrobiota bacterium]